MGEMDDYYQAIDEKELKNGSMKLVNVEGTQVLLVRQSDKIFAVDNRCPHQGCALSGGVLDGLVVVCPCHDWRFNLVSGEYEEEPALKLKKLEWKVKDGKIWVKLED